MSEPKPPSAVESVVGRAAVWLESVKGRQDPQTKLIRELVEALRMRGQEEVAAEWYLCTGCSRSVVPVISGAVLDNGTTWTCSECGAKTVVSLSPIERNP